MTIPAPPPIKPPGSNSNRVPSGVSQPMPEKPPPPDIPTITTVNGKLASDEATFILMSTLRPEHHGDPNVLRFIANYMRCRNAAQAARESGLHSTAGLNLRHRPDIALAIRKLSEKSMDKFGFDAAEIVERVKEIGNVDPADLEYPDGTYKRLSDIAPEVRRAIKKFTAKNVYSKDPNGMPIVTGQLINVEFWDKMKAVELLGREKDLFTEKKKVEHDVTGNMANFLLESRDRAEQRFLDAARAVSDEAKVVHQLMAPPVDAEIDDDEPE